MWEWVKDFWMNTVVAGLLVIAIGAFAALSIQYYLDLKKKKNAEKIKNTSNNTPSQRKRGSKKKKGQSTAVSQTEDPSRIVAEMDETLRSIRVKMILLLLAIVIMGAIGYVLYKLYESNGPDKNDAKVPTITSSGDVNERTQIDASTPSSTPTATPTLTPILTLSPTPTLTLTATPTPTYSPSLPFQEEGEIMYGDLTMYIGMTAGEVISRIGKPYTYQAIEDFETGSTGGLWFDKDVMFTFCDSEDTLDKSCKVYMVWVQNPSGNEKVAKNIGNGMNSTMNSETLDFASGFSLAQFQKNRLNGGVVARIQCEEILYDFYWGLGDAPYSLDEAPELIIILQVPPEENEGAESSSELMTNYLKAYQSGSFAAMSDLLWPHEIEEILLYKQLDREDFNRILSNRLYEKLEANRLVLFPDDECAYNYRLVKERYVEDDDFENLFALRSFRYARYKPQRIAIFDEVCVNVDDPELGQLTFPFIGDEVVVICYDGRWYLPSAYSGFWGTTEDQVHSKEAVNGLSDFAITK